MSDWTKDVSNPELLPIPEDHRKSTPVAQFWIWFSAQVAVVTWAAGTLPIVLGLGLKESLFAIIVGNIIGCLLFAAIGVIGKGTGVNQMVVGRMPFGRVGNNLACLMNALMEIGWPSVLTYFSVTALVAIAGLFGIEIGTAGKVILALLTVGIQVAITAYGFRVITRVQNILGPIMLVCAIVMTIIVFAKGVKWEFATTLEDAAHTSTWWGIFAALGVCWAVSWAPCVDDYSRYVSPRYSNKSYFWWTFFGIYSAIWLMSIGAMVAATYGTDVDPAEMVTKLVPGFSLPGLILVFFGVISTNIVSNNSGVLSIMSMGVKLSRPAISWLFLGVIPFVVTVYSMIISDIATVFDMWLLSLIFILSPWAAIIIVDWFWVRKQRANIKSLYVDTGEPDDYGRVNWRGVGTWVASYVVGALFAVTPKFTGPIAKAMGGLDIGWIVTMVFAGAVYYILETNHLKKVDQLRTSGSVANM